MTNNLQMHMLQAIGHARYWLYREVKYRDPTGPTFVT
jgi:hypothetical protein